MSPYLRTVRGATARLPTKVTSCRVRWWLGSAGSGEFQNGHGAVVEVAYVGLVAAGLYRDAGRPRAGWDGFGYSIGCGVDHRDSIAAVINDVS